MLPWLAKAMMMLSSVLLVVIPAYVHRRDVPKAPATSRKGPSERILLAVVSIAFLLTLAWIFFPHPVIR
jgi:hypothetical protein